MKKEQNTVLSIVMAFLVMILLIQLWLLTGALEAYMGGEGSVGIPAALVSSVCLFVAAWLVRSLP